nr:ribosomal protein L14 [Paralia sulcata]
MIQQQTILQVSDNSGAKTVKCIKVLGGFRRKFAYSGDFIIVSVQELRNKSRITSKVLKGEIHKAIILRTKYKNKKKDGSNFFFNENSVILINKQGKPIATRILGPIPKKLRLTKLMKLASISSGFF